ncbi:acyltransferase family protein [Fuscovulum ytuae]|uniref:Acyltransferase family protein n=2 Tax=Fuscovulum ytuae TaxID=3042299 RepID=A0ABY8Q481_9RHOB|nr:acyltransferase family protein [Fuscovulum sp. YMD61]WGV15427.1 acyltransferase family protein [Fuscovulum sp. YMD61]
MSVIVYHARFTVGGDRILQGGYLGVDLFFLISGFLIGGIVTSELREGRFSLWNFYERRARRILPALVCVLVASSVAAVLLMTPAALREFSQSLVSTIFFFSNIHFLFQDSYTAAPSQLQPLLHTWSLSVEEQFYLVLPLALLLLRRRAQFQMGILSVLSVLSLMLASTLVTTNNAAAFFLPFSRAWELLIGAILAQVLLDSDRVEQPSAARYLPSLGAGIVVVSIAFFDETTPHPSIITLLPILGGVLIIGWANPWDPATRLLASRPLVAVGLASYSLYLWHFPIFAFLRIGNDGTGTSGLMVSGMVLTAVLSALTWRWVEQPFRRRDSVPLRMFYLWAGLPLVGSLVLATVVLTRPVEGAYPSIPSDFFASFEVFEPSTGPADCIDQNGFMNPTTWCQLGVDGSRPSFLLVGDSHAEALAASIDAAARKMGLSGRLVARSGCPLLLGLEPQRGQPMSQQCADLAERALDYVERESIKTVIFASRWNYYTCGEPKPDCGFTQNIRALGGEWPASLAERTLVLSIALNQTLAAYLSSGAELHIVTQVPHQLRDPKEVFEAYFAGQDDALTAMALPVADHQVFGAAIGEMFRSAVAVYPDVVIHDPGRVLCGKGGICRIGAEYASFYSDDDHLSVGSATVMSDWAQGILR